MVAARKLGLASAAIAAMAVWSWGARPQPSPQPSRQPAPVDIQIRNVNFRLSKDVVLEIRSLRGQLQRTKADVPVTFDDSASFLVEIDSAEVAMRPESLTALMNSYVMAYDRAPIKNLQIAIKGDRLIQKGTIHKVVDVPFEMEGSLSATPEGEIRMHAEKLKAARLPVKGLLNLLGKDLSDLVKANSARGMRVEGDDIILSPRSLTPPPHLQGRVTRVAIAGGRIVQYFDSGRRLPALKPPHRSGAYIYHRNGVLRFGKLTMDDADLQIVGDRRGGYFEFFQREYQKQLVAGYSKNTAANGLVAHMADYSRFRTRESTGSSAPGKCCAADPEARLASSGQRR
jgi:hypothetical protein